MKAFGIQAIALSVSLFGSILSGTASAKVDYTGPVSPATSAAFETASNWTATAPELTPPGPDSAVFIQNLNGSIALTQDRTLGNIAIGNGAGNEVQTFVISANVTFTGQERNTEAPVGEINPARRGQRIGREDTTPTDGRTPWGVVKQTAGTVEFDYGDGSDNTGNPGRAQLVMSTDKDNSAGSIWEVGGTASLIGVDDVRIGDRVALTSPGSIFRVRGSQVGQVIVEDQYKAVSRGGLWDAHRNENNRLTYNRGKSVTEFVLDAGGVTPITVMDDLYLTGGLDSYPAGHMPETGTEFTLSFLRIKLSEPTTAGSGAVGSGQELVLFQADRIFADSGVTTGTDLDEGRFYDPDHAGVGGGHQPLFDSDNPLEPGTIYHVLADYAGAQYSWRIDYFDSPDDGTVVNAVVLSELQKTGVEGDLNGDSMVTEADRTDLLAAISAFAANPLGHHDLLGGAQNLYDLNADDRIDNLDRQLFATYFLAETGIPGDFNGDMKVDAADYTVWRNNLNMPEGDLLNGNGNGGTIDQTDYTLWKSNFGTGLGSGALGASAVPEPGTLLMCLVSVLGLVGFRRRSA